MKNIYAIFERAIVIYDHSLLCIVSLYGSKFRSDIVV